MFRVEDKSSGEFSKELQATRALAKAHLSDIQKFLPKYTALHEKMASKLYRISHNLEAIKSENSKKSNELMKLVNKLKEAVAAIGFEIGSVLSYALLIAKKPTDPLDLIEPKEAILNHYYECILKMSSNNSLLLTMARLKRIAFYLRYKDFETFITIVNDVEEIIKYQEVDSFNSDYVHIGSSERDITIKEIFDLFNNAVSKDLSSIEDSELIRMIKCFEKLQSKFGKKLLISLSDHKNEKKDQNTLIHSHAELRALHYPDGIDYIKKMVDVLKNKKSHTKEMLKVASEVIINAIASYLRNGNSKELYDDISHLIADFMKYYDGPILLIAKKMHNILYHELIREKKIHSAIALGKKYIAYLGGYLRQDQEKDREILRYYRAHVALFLGVFACSDAFKLYYLGMSYLQIAKYYFSGNGKQDDVLVLDNFAENFFRGKSDSVRQLIHNQGMPKLNSYSEGSEFMDIPSDTLEIREILDVSLYKKTLLLFISKTLSIYDNRKSYLEIYHFLFIPAEKAPLSLSSPAVDSEGSPASKSNRMLPKTSVDHGNRRLEENKARAQQKKWQKEQRRLDQEAEKERKAQQKEKEEMLAKQRMEEEKQALAEESARLAKQKEVEERRKLAKQKEIEERLKLAKQKVEIGKNLLARLKRESKGSIEELKKSEEEPILELKLNDNQVGEAIEFKRSIESDSKAVSPSATSDVKLNSSTVTLSTGEEKISFDQIATFLSIYSSDEGHHSQDKLEHIHYILQKFLRDFIEKSERHSAAFGKLSDSDKNELIVNILNSSLKSFCRASPSSISSVDTLYTALNSMIDKMIKLYGRKRVCVRKITLKPIPLSDEMANDVLLKIASQIDALNRAIYQLQDQINQRYGYPAALPLVLGTRVVLFSSSYTLEKQVKYRDMIQSLCAVDLLEGVLLDRTPHNSYYEVIHLFNQEKLFIGHNAEFIHLFLDRWLLSLANRDPMIKEKMNDKLYRLDSMLKIQKCMLELSFYEGVKIISPRQLNRLLVDITESIVNNHSISVDHWREILSNQRAVVLPVESLSPTLPTASLAFIPNVRIWTTVSLELFGYYFQYFNKILHEKHGHMERLRTTLSSLDKPIIARQNFRK